VASSDREPTGAVLAQSGPPIAGVLGEPSGLAIELLDNGAVFAIRHGSTLINQVLGSALDGSLGNVWLRRRARGGVTPIPLLGPGAVSKFGISSTGARWAGSADGLAWACTLRVAPDEPTWSWSILITNTTTRRLSVDAVLAQDLGIADEAAVRTSELYASQYIDHTVLTDGTLGYVLCSRQNLPQAGGAHPWILHACLEGAAMASSGRRPGWRPRSPAGGSRTGSSRTRSRFRPSSRGR